MEQNRVMHRLVFLILLLGALVVAAGQSGAADANEYPYMNEYPLPVGAGAPEDIVAIEPGHVWFTLPETNQVGELMVTTPDDYDFDLYTLPPGSAPKAIAYTNGAAWLTAPGRNSLLRVEAGGGWEEWPLPEENSQPAGIAAGPAGNLWIAATGSNQILRFAPGTEQFTQYNYSTADAGINEITVYNEDTIYFTAENVDRVVLLTPSRYPSNAFTPAPLSDPILGPVGTPGQVAVNDAGHLWVAVADRNLLGFFAPGTFSYWGWVEVAAVGIEPFGLALSEMGSVKLVWFTLPEVGRIGLHGRSAEGLLFVRTHSIPTTGSVPRSIAVDNTNHGWIAVSGSNLIAEWVPPYNDAISLPLIVNN